MIRGFVIVLALFAACDKRGNSSAAPPTAERAPGAATPEQAAVTTIASETTALRDAIGELGGRLAKTLATIDAATSDAERAAATAALDKLSAERAALVARAKPLESLATAVYNQTWPADRQGVDERALKELVAAKKDAELAIETLAVARKELDELAAKRTAGIDKLTAAQNDADRTAAKAKLEQLRREAKQPR